jgi:hypothetical protein
MRQLATGASPSFIQDANYHKPNCQRTVPRKPPDPSVLRLSLAVLMDRGQARVS